MALHTFYDRRALTADDRKKYEDLDGWPKSHRMESDDQCQCKPSTWLCDAEPYESVFQVMHHPFTKETVM